MAATTQMLYFASDAPFPLPTETATDAAPNMYMEYGGRRIVEVERGLVVKFGEGVDLAEGENMLYVREMTEVPVPRVYALYSKAGRVESSWSGLPAGQTLSALWSDLTSSEKGAIVSKLRTHFEELRNLPPPRYYGSLGEKRLLNGIFWTQKPEPKINGPFTSEAALTEAMALKYTHDGRLPYRADFFRQYLPRAFCNHRPTFNHGKYQRKIIMVHKSEHPDGHRLDIAIIDWEMDGWYPSYWEYALATLRWDDDWCLWVEKVLDPFAPEAALLQAIRLGLWS